MGRGCSVSRNRNQCAWAPPPSAVRASRDGRFSVARGGPPPRALLLTSPARRDPARSSQQPQALGFAAARPRTSSREEKASQWNRKPNSVRLRSDASHPSFGATTIPLAPPSLARSSDRPGGFGRAVLERLPIWPCSVRGFACHQPCGRCGALLPHLFTLTRLRRAVFFLCHFPSGHPDRALPGALPFGVRTFLPRRGLRAPLAPGPAAGSGRLVHCDDESVPGTGARPHITRDCAPHSARLVPSAPETGLG
jgi:hypothetical protein